MGAASAANRNICQAMFTAEAAPTVKSLPSRRVVFLRLVLFKFGEYFITQ
jgi:hypothetical protein